MRRPWTRLPRVPLLFCLLALPACGSSFPMPPSPGPDPGRQDKHRLIDYAEKLPYRTRLGAASRLELPDEKVVVQIEPELASHRLSPAELSAGRVVARFHKSRGGSVPRFGLGEADTVSYWLVYRKGTQAYGRFVSESQDTTYKIEITMHTAPEEGLDENIPWGQAIAQFQYREAGFMEHDGRGKKGRGAELPDLAVGTTTGWVSCSPYGCCRTQ